MLKSFYTPLLIILCGLFLGATPAYSQDLYFTGQLPSGNFTAQVNNPSAEQAFTLYGEGLVDPVTITLPSPFEVSADGQNYSGSISFSPDPDPFFGGGIDATVYVRFNPTTTGTYNAILTAINPLAQSQDITLSGNATSQGIEYHWNVASGDWNNASSWDPARPTSSAHHTDILIFDGSRAGGTFNVNLNQSQSLGQISFINNASATFSVASNQTLTFGAGQAGADFLIDATSNLSVISSNTGIGATFSMLTGSTADIYGTLSLKGVTSSTQAAHQILATESGAIKVRNNGKIVSGIGSSTTVYPFGSTVAGSVQFQSGAIYHQVSGISPFGSNISTQVTAFENGSTFIYEGGIVPLPRTYANLTIVKTGGTSIANSAEGNFVVRNLRIDPATTASVLIGHNTQITVSGDIFVKTNSILHLGPNPNTASYSDQSLIFNGSQQTFTGNITFGSKALASIANGTTINLVSGLTVSNSLTIAGTLNAADKVISGAGSVSVTGNGKILTSHANGLSGTLATTGTKTLANGDYEYTGTGSITESLLPSTVKKITINKTSGDVTLNSTVTVENELVFANGKINTSAAHLLKVKQTTAISGANANSYVEGPMQMEANTAASFPFTFPIGKNGDYRPVSLTLDHSTNATTLYNAELFEATPQTRTLTGELTGVTDKRYFSINKIGGSPLESAHITLSCDDDYGDIGALNNSADPRIKATIAKSNTNGQWVDLGEGEGADYDATAKTLTSAVAFTEFSDFVFATGSYSTLPVSIVKLNAKANETSVKVEWTTAMEENSHFFDVERSADAKNFTKVGRVESKGNSNYQIDYTFLDANPLSGVAYYRLRQVDFDGTASYFGPVAARIDASVNTLAVYPNPATSVANLTLELAPAEKAQVRVFTLIGTTVLEKTITAEAGINTYEVPVKSLQPGAYIIEVTTAAGKTASRFVKQ